MTTGPSIARIAALIGDPARANMLCALMDGRALTASELSHVAGVTPSTTSSHLTQMVDAGLLARAHQGRHRYFKLATPAVAGLIEHLMGVSAQVAGPPPRTGPKEPALREARVCYHHLAGRRGVQLYEALLARGILSIHDGHPQVTPAGMAFLTEFGIDLAALRGSRTPLCRACLDWSERRDHLAGSLGRALLSRFEDLRWVRRVPSSRAVQFSPPGLRAFERAFLRDPAR